MPLYAVKAGNFEKIPAQGTKVFGARCRSSGYRAEAEGAAFRIAKRSLAAPGVQAAFG
jgi:hypothetical protein